MVITTLKVHYLPHNKSVMHDRKECTEGEVAYSICDRSIAPVLMMLLIARLHSKYNVSRGYPMLTSDDNT